MTHVQEFLTAHPDVAVSVHCVWVPTFPRELEEEALPDMAARVRGPAVAQYWDGAKALGRECFQRIVPEFLGGDTVWDTYVLFDAEATWAGARHHLLGWDYTVADKRDQLFDLLTSVG